MCGTMCGKERRERGDGSFRSRRRGGREGVNGRFERMGSKDTHTFSVFGFIKRKYKSGKLFPPADVEKVFEKYAENDMMTAGKLKEFLHDVQGETDVTLEDAQKLLVEQQLVEGREGLSLDSFFQYLLDPTANLARDDKVHQDMTLPVSHYFIYTGHNSYLTGNQLSSDCSVDPIIDSLKRGVRVVELDLWANKKDETQISVLHGGTMTSPVPFETCMVAIRDNAFVASPYPVVITFEDHLSPELQAKASEITTRVLGKLLKIPDQNEKFTEFPSPESLKGRILISTKPPREYLKEKNRKEVVVQKVEKFTDKVKHKKGKKGVIKEEFDWGDEFPDLDNSSEVPLEEDEYDSDEEVDEEGQIDGAAHPEYKRIIAIRAGKPKGASLESSLRVDEFVKRISLSEPQLEKVAEKKPFALISFTERNLLRVYPGGLRINSSNYNPLIAWSHGAQMVAFNMQGYGRPLWLVQGFFKANGSCGYVQKPKFLFPTENGIRFDPRKKLAPKMTLKVKVIMGLGWLEKFGKHYFDKYSPPDFYTRVGIAGVPADRIMKKTEPIEDEWLPRWEADFEFQLSVPELAVLRVEVHEYDMGAQDDFGGQTCLPVSEIKRGFRCIPLLDKKGRPLEGVRLLCHFDIIPLS